MSILSHCHHHLNFSYLSSKTGVYECSVCEQRPPKKPSRFMQRWGAWLLFTLAALLAGAVSR